MVTVPPPPGLPTVQVRFRAIQQLQPEDCRALLQMIAACNPAEFDKAAGACIGPPYMAYDRAMSEVIVPMLREIGPGR